LVVRLDKLCELFFEFGFVLDKAELVDFSNFGLELYSYFFVKLTWGYAGKVLIFFKILGVFRVFFY